jgi:hypothetical protein
MAATATATTDARTSTSSQSTESYTPELSEYTEPTTIDRPDRAPPSALPEKAVAAKDECGATDRNAAIPPKKRRVGQVSASSPDQAVAATCRHTKPCVLVFCIGEEHDACRVIKIEHRVLDRQMLDLLSEIGGTYPFGDVNSDSTGLLARLQYVAEAVDIGATVGAPSTDRSPQTIDGFTAYEPADGTVDLSSGEYVTAAYVVSMYE